MQKNRSTVLSTIIALGPALIGAAGLLFLGYVKLFGGGRIPKVLTGRQVNDWLLVFGLALMAGIYLFLRPRMVRDSAPRRPCFDRRWLIVLVVMILLAAGLRFHRLELQSLWRDEIASVARVESASLPDALTLGNWQDAWPSYHIPLYVFVKLAGDSEFAFRFLSTLAGTLLIPVLFVLGRRMFSVREGLIAAGLAIALRTPLWYSQEMRSYAFLMLFSALSVYFWYRLAEDLVWRGRSGAFVMTGYAASAILTIYAHYFGLILIGVEGLAALLLIVTRLRRLPMALVAAYGAIGAAYLPWLPLIFSDLGKEDFWTTKPPGMGGPFFDFLTFVYGNPLVTIALGLGAIAGVAVLWHAFRHRGDARALPLAVTPGVLLAGWLIAPYAVAYWRSVTSTPILVDRYLLVSLPAACLLLARAATRFPGGKIGQGVVGAGLVGFVIAQLVTGPYYVEPNKTQLREAVRYMVSREAETPNQVIIAGYQGGQRELDYYFRKDGSSSTITIKAGNTWQIEDVRAQLGELHPKYIWFIGQHLFYEKEFEEFLAHDYKPLEEKKFFDVTVFLYGSEK